jgi:protein-tyrosine phosphatase
MEESFHLVSSRLFLSDSTCGLSISFLKLKKVTHILICALELPVSFPDHFEYKKLPIQDRPKFDLQPFFNDGVSFIHESLAKGGIVLVYCNQGISRSPSLVLGYFIKYKHLSLEVSLKYLKSVHPDTCPNKGFLKFLRKFEKKNHDQTSLACKCILF